MAPWMPPVQVSQGARAGKNLIIKKLHKQSGFEGTLRSWKRTPDGEAAIQTADDTWTQFIGKYSFDRNIQATLGENSAAIKKIYTAFNEEVTKKAPRGGGSEASRAKKWWKENIAKYDPQSKVYYDKGAAADASAGIKNHAKNFCEKKSTALLSVRDNLFNKFVETIKANVVGPAAYEDDGYKETTYTVNNEYARTVVGGILQFTHSAITTGVCEIPYIKLTGFLNTSKTASKYNKSALSKISDTARIDKIQRDIFSTIDPPNISKIVPDRSSGILGFGGDKGEPDVEIRIQKRGAVSFSILIGIVFIT